MSDLKPVSDKRRARLLTKATLLALPIVASISLMAYGQTKPVEAESSDFEHKERSTIETIRFRSIEEEVLANTIIEGGLEAPAAGVPVQSGPDDDLLLDPLALQPRDSRTDLGRSEIPVDIRFSNPKNIPGQTHSNKYTISLPANRTYNALNINTTDRP